jgi:SOS response regulatory protein OraA/RecX
MWYFHLYPRLKHPLEDVVQQERAVGDVLAAAWAQAARCWPRLARETDCAKRRQKRWAFVRRRGFPAALVQQVLTEMAEESAAGGAVELPL